MGRLRVNPHLNGVHVVPCNRVTCIWGGMTFHRLKIRQTQDLQFLLNMGRDISHFDIKITLEIERFNHF